MINYVVSIWTYTTQIVVYFGQNLSIFKKWKNSVILSILQLKTLCLFFVFFLKVTAICSINYKLLFKMSTVWEFVKRHRGKIIASGALVGSAYAVKKVYDSELVKEYVHSSTHQEHEVQLSQARRHFIFDAHQQSCDKNLAESIIDIKAILKSRYPIEILVESLKDSDGITNDQKIQIWEDIKHKSISRIISTSVSLSIIIIATKIQKSILCSEMCKIVEETRQRQATATHGIKSYVSSLIWGKDDATKQNYGSQFANPQVQQVFVNCIQFLTTSGLNQIFAKVEAITEEYLTNFSLTKKITVSELETLVYQSLDKFEKEVGEKNYCDYIVPVTNVRTKFDGSDATNLESLLSRFVALLQITTCRQLMHQQIRIFIQKAITFIKNETEKEGEQPLAKYLPIIADAFIVQSKSNHDSAFQECLHLRELHQFTLIAFESDTSAILTIPTPKVHSDFALD
jgi:hypothetical protein